MWCALVTVTNPTKEHTMQALTNLAIVMMPVGIMLLAIIIEEISQ
jgi:hypothetical protein